MLVSPQTDQDDGTGRKMHTLFFFFFNEFVSQHYATWNLFHRRGSDPKLLKRVRSRGTESFNCASADAQRQSVLFTLEFTILHYPRVS